MKRARYTLLMMVALLVVSISGIPSVSSQSESDSLQTGPYVDEVIYRIIPNQDQRVLALQAGEIEMDTSFFDPVFLETFDADPDIDIFSALRNGYGHIDINCRDYPLNISGLRRAFAFAFDKTRVTNEVMDGFSIEHDSLVPYPNGWCVEDQFDWHYYTAQPDIGNQILDELNFTIDSETGFRLAPDGTPFDIVFEYSGGGMSYKIPPICMDALVSLHINASSRLVDFNDYMSRLESHGDYDMVFYSKNFYDNDVDWLAYEYWSEYSDTPYQNPTNFANTTYDLWRDELLYGTTYEEVNEAATEMQKILHYNVPRLVIYENTYLQAYRNDQFTGHVEDLSRYISGLWTMRKIHKIDGTPGGTVSIALSQEPDSFNIYLTDSQYSTAILSELWPSLYKYGPNLTPVPDIAESMLSETYSDNPAIPDGHTRFTIDIIQNATWSDDEPLTANDVAFSLTYAFESAIYGNPAGTDVGDLAAVYAPTPSRVIIEFNTESYWHFSNFAFDYIIPEHIFNDDTGIGYMGWNTWNPVFDPAEPNVNCGPFIFTDYEFGEFYEINRNPLFHYAADLNDINSTTDTTSLTNTTTTTNQTSNPMLSWSFVFSAALSTGSGIVIIYCTVRIIQNRKLRETT
ncbi:MAG: ABC transporter substrate-binding protein [Candidatus Thorarchaeota archaeon]